MTATPHGYIEAVADALNAVGVPTADAWAQPSDRHDHDVYEGLIEIDVDNPDIPVALAWDQERGWRVLNGRKPGLYSNSDDLMVAVDDDPAVVARAAAVATWVRGAKDAR